MSSERQRAQVQRESAEGWKNISDLTGRSANNCIALAEKLDGNARLPVWYMPGVSRNGAETRGTPVLEVADYQKWLARRRGEYVHDESGPRAVHPLDAKIDALAAQIADLTAKLAAVCAPTVTRRRAPARKARARRARSSAR